MATDDKDTLQFRRIKIKSWDSPATREELRGHLRELAAAWRAVSHAVPADPQALALARVLHGLVRAVDGDDAWLGDVAKSARLYLRKSGETVRRDRSEAAEDLAVLVSGWLNGPGGRATAQEMAAYFYIEIMDEPAFHEDLAQALHFANGRQEAEAALAAAFEKLLLDDVDDPERYIKRGLITLGYPELKAHGIFKYRDARARRS